MWSESVDSGAGRFSRLEISRPCAATSAAVASAVVAAVTVSAAMAVGRGPLAWVVAVLPAVLAGSAVPSAAVLVAAVAAD